MEAAYITLGVGLGLLLLWRTVAVCLRFGAWTIPVVFLLDFLAGLVGHVPGFLIWNLGFFYGASRWDPVRGMFRLPRWPRAPYMRGARRPRHRRIDEPMPWDRGPFSY
jgi:hypothetical protein